MMYKWPVLECTHPDAEMTRIVNGFGQLIREDTYCFDCGWAGDE